jgi:hypothetical protein
LEIPTSPYNQLSMYWHFVWGLRGFLKEPCTLSHCREMIKLRLENRVPNLLSLVKLSIYENKNSPYLKLLQLIGCEYGDFEKMVLCEGVEGSLQKLAGEGVYISIEEFKGKKEVVRSGKVLKFKESDFDNPFISNHLEARSSGTRSSGTRTIYDFDHLIANRVIYMMPTFDACGVFGFPSAIWAPILPGSGPQLVLSCTKAGQTPIKWFSPIEKRNFKPSLKNRIGTSFIIYAGRLAGAKLPRPEFVSFDDAGKIATWMAGVIKCEGGCCLHAYPSLAVRVCQTALERGIDLEGASFFVGGEPVTEAKRKEIELVGAVVHLGYVFSEAGFVGLDCLNPHISDDVHLLKDSFALVQQLREVSHATTSVNAFLFSTLLPSAPKILLNVESGDWGVVERRNCGCKLEELGLIDHIHSIRGFDKLTGEGMTFIGTDLVRIIEEVLPVKFGGSSTDYQMVEEEDEQGHTRMIVLASPNLGAINETELVKTLLNELSKGQDTQRMMAEMWDQAHTIKVRREQPFTTTSGKLMPLHINRHVMNGQATASSAPLSNIKQGDNFSE